MIHFLASLAFLRSSVITGELRWSSAARASGQYILQEGSQRCPAISPGSRELKELCSISVDLGAPGKCPVSSPRMSIDEKKQLWFHQLRSACMRFDDRSHLPFQTLPGEASSKYALPASELEAGLEPSQRLQVDGMIPGPVEARYTQKIIPSSGDVHEVWQT